MVVTTFDETYVRSEFPIAFGVLSITFGAILGALFGTLDWDSLYGEKFLVFCFLLMTIAFFILNLSGHTLRYGGMERWWSSTMLLLLNLLPMLITATQIFDEWHVFAALMIIWTGAAYLMKFVMWKIK